MTSIRNNYDLHHLFFLLDSGLVKDDSFFVCDSEGNARALVNLPMWGRGDHGMGQKSPILLKQLLCKSFTIICFPFPLIILGHECPDSLGPARTPLFHLSLKNSYVSALSGWPSRVASSLLGLEATMVM